jgi:hypothetical protein
VYHFQALFKVPSTCAVAAALLGPFATHMNEKDATAVLKVVLLGLAVPVRTNNQTLVKGLVCALHHIIAHHAWAVLLAIRHYNELAVLREGDLHGMKEVVEHVDTTKEAQKAFSMNELALLNEKLVVVFKSKDVDVAGKELALQILSSLCLRMNTEAVTNVIDYICKVLDGSTNPQIHDACSVQLTKVREWVVNVCVCVSLFLFWLHVLCLCVHV